MNTPVSFDMKMLLIEKGMPLHYAVRYETDTTIEEVIIHDKPTIADVVMWIYAKHKIWIWVSMEIGYRVTFCWQITGDSTSSNYKSNFKNPIEAYTAAIVYVLKNLIK